MKRILFLLAVLVLTSCGGKSEKKFTTLADFKGAKIASERGTIFASFIDRAIPRAEHQFYDRHSDILAALNEGRADAACFDMPIARYIVAQNPELVMFPYPVENDRYGFAVAKGSDLGVKANEILQGAIKRGTMRRLKDAWFSEDGGKKELPVLNYRTDFDGSAGTLRYGFAATTIPASYVGADGNPTGLELEIVSRIAYVLNMKVEFTPMLFSELLQKLSEGSVDMVGGVMSITEERLKTFDFVGPYMEGGMILVIKRNRAGKWIEEKSDY
jgi:ABC-type amino acid transport substrate-binding protein